MSRVGQSRLACWAALVVIGAGIHEALSDATLAAEAKTSTKQAAVLETFAKPDGQAYFALALSPQVTQPKPQPHDIVILFDTSASQTGVFRAKALGALRAMLEGLDANDRVAILAVDVNAVPLTSSLVAPAGAAIDQTVAALERRVPLGSTDMRQALET
ncbi:MAG: hypothetical protein ACREHD_21390, partial [Pirellulales bacterium]